MTTFDTRPGDVSSHDDDGASGIASTKATAPGWYSDPFEMHRMRYFSGSDWTDHVTHFGPTPCLGCH